MDCLDSTDISIRLRALDLVSGMVSSGNLITVVGRLMRQLRSPVTLSLLPDQGSDQAPGSGVDPMADSDDETPEINIKTTGKRVDTSPLLRMNIRLMSSAEYLRCAQPIITVTF